MGRAVPVPTRSTWSDRSTEPSQLQFENQTSQELSLWWLDYEGNEVPYGSVRPQRRSMQNTFSTHPWRIRDARSGTIFGTYMGPSAIVQILGPNQLRVLKPEEDTEWQRPEWGGYVQRDVACGIPIMAYECVGNDAVQIARHTVECMLWDTPLDIKQRIVANGARLAIIGRCQVTSDIPAHHFLKHSDGRDIDGTTRGLGGNKCCPTTSCAEENLTMIDDRKYRQESILVHEFGHAVKDLGMAAEDIALVDALHKRAHASGTYDNNCYMMSNADEYWAEGTQAWFDATIRVDVTSGVNTREKLKAHDPQLAAVMAKVYGNGVWRYPHTAPRPFQGHQPLQALKQQFLGNLINIHANTAATLQPSAPQPLAALPGAGHYPAAPAVQRTMLQQQQQATAVRSRGCMPGWLSCWNGT